MFDSAYNCMENKAHTVTENSCSEKGDVEIDLLWNCLTRNCWLRNFGAEKSWTLTRTHYTSILALTTPAFRFLNVAVWSEWLEGFCSWANL